MLINNIQQPPTGVNQTSLAENANNDSSNATQYQEQLKKDAKNLLQQLMMFSLIKDLNHGKIPQKYVQNLQNLICLLITDIKNMKNSSDTSDQQYIQRHPEFDKLDQEMSAVPCKGFVPLNQAAKNLDTFDMYNDLLDLETGGARKNLQAFLDILQDIYKS